MNLKFSKSDLPGFPILFCLFFIVINFFSCSKKENFYSIRNGLQNSKIVFEQTQKGRVAFLGGSITNMNGWREMICESLAARFPQTDFEFINAGIPSTGSTPGAFRLKRDVFSRGKIDLLFEEAAVNDATNCRTAIEQIRGMEGIIRQARILNPFIDIVMFHFADPDKIESYQKNEVPEVIKNHECVAGHYQIPSLNLALEVTRRISRGEFSWEKDFVDLHPSPFGNRLYARSICQLLDMAWALNKTGNTVLQKHGLPEKLDQFSYDNGRLITVDEADSLRGFIINPGWVNSDSARTRPGFVNVPMLIGTRAGSSLTFSFSGTAAGIFVAAGPDAGIVEYRTDQSSWKKIDLFTKWSHYLHIPWLYMLETELSRGPHILELRITSQKNMYSKGNACRIVHFAVNG